MRSFLAQASLSDLSLTELAELVLIMDRVATLACINEADKPYASRAGLSSICE